jgi:hypothetical protein
MMFGESGMSVPGTQPMISAADHSGGFSFVDCIGRLAQTLFGLIFELSVRYNDGLCTLCHKLDWG